MARTPKAVTDAELAVLEALWRSGPSTIRAIADTLYANTGNSGTATVQKLCERLLSKGYVSRDRSVRPATFAADVDRNDLIGRHLESIADKLCEGSLSPLLTHLVESSDLSRDDLRALREQVERLDQARGKQ